MRTISFSRTPSGRPGHLATASVAALLSVVVGACGGGGDGAPTQPQPAAVASVTVALSASTARVGEPVTATATLRDASGQPVTGRAVTWASSTPAVATVDGAGAITTLTPGSTMISATSEGRSGSATLTVLAPVVVTLAVVDGDRQQARAGTSVVVPPVIVARDASGGAVGGIRLRFTVLSGGGSVGAAVVTTDASGRASPGAWTLGSALGEQQLEVGAADGSVSVTAPVRIRATAVGPNEPVTAPVRSYTIATTTTVTLTDSVTGLRFRFSDAAQGTLDVARVVGGTAPPSATAILFRAEYRGTGRVQVAGIAPPGGAADAYAWADWRDVMTAGPGGPRWWGLAPAETRGDTSWYRLPAGGAAGAARVALPLRDLLFADVAAGSAVLAIDPHVSADAARRQASRQVAEQTVQWWLDNVPFAAVAAMHTRMESMPYHQAWGRGSTGYYQYSLMTWYTPTVYVDLNADITQGTRHEMGHYLTHMLLGTDRYKALEEYAPRDGHALGALALGHRNTLVEEYSHIAQHLQQGHITQYDLRSLARVNNWRDLMAPFPPSQFDAPSLEGFATAMALALTRGPADTLVYDFSADGHQSRAPAFGVTARQLMEVLAAGPSTPMALRDLLVPLAGGDVGMAAVVEPLGWSYRGAGRVLDGAGIPVAGVTIASVVRVVGKDYATPASAPTGTDGRFTLTRIYPGTSSLRLYRQRSGGGIDSATVATLTVAWSKPTPDTVAIGDLVHEDFADLTRFSVRVVGLTAPNQLGVGPPTCTSNFTTTEQLPSSWTGTTAFPLTWDGPQFSAQGSTRYDVPTGYTSGPIGVTYAFDMSVYGVIVGRSADTLRLALQVRYGRRETEYYAPELGKSPVVRVIQTADYALQNFPVASTSSGRAGTLTGSAAAATLVNGWQFHYRSVAPDAPWSTNQWDCSAYTLGPGARIEVQLIRR